MSADNFVAIVKKGRNYTGYHCSASLSYPYVKCFDCQGSEAFKVTKIRQAIDLAQSKNTEYGFAFYIWKDEATELCPCEQKRFADGIGEE